jgi:hypothetical protein
MAALACSLVLIAGCKALDPPPTLPQTVVVRVSSDPGKPLANAQVLFSGKQVGITGADGAADIQLAGKDGESFDVMVACPKGFESPNKPIRVAFRRLADSTKKPEYAVQCPPKTRTVVVAVRTEGYTEVPVTLLGREIARTDDSGAAHVVLTLEPGEQFDLMLDTSEKRFEHLQPQNPVASFSIGHRNDIFTFDQKFETEKKKVFRRGPSRPKPSGPQKIQ